MTEGAGIRRYLTRAFLLRWNLLLFGGGMVGALLSGSQDVLVPAVLACEIGYLALLVGLEGFRKVVDSEVLAEKAPVNAEAEQIARQAQAEGLFRSLSPGRAERLARLRQRCLDMRLLAQAVNGGVAVSTEMPSSGPALDRLLWVFLKLLVSEQALERFLMATNSEQIEAQLSGFRGKLAAVAESDVRLQRALADSVATAELRLNNYRRAESNAQFVAAELDRLEAKIQALTETSVSHEDPDYISAQVNSIAQSMAQTEAEIRELDELTGLAGDDVVPEILEPPRR